MFIDDLATYLKTQDGSKNHRIMLSKAIRYQINNVAHYIQDIQSNMSEGESFIVGEKIPNMAPLAPLAWFEYDNSGHEGCLMFTAYDSKTPDLSGLGKKYSARFSDFGDVRWII